MTLRIMSFAVWLAFSPLVLQAGAASGKFRPVTGTRGMVVSDDLAASEWGAETLRRGGNAADAAVATAFMLAVTRPYFASLGGGGFLIYCPRPGAAGASPCQALDFREEAPSSASRDMYVGPNAMLSQDGALASGVPGVPAGLLALLDKHGSKGRRELLKRPIAAAEGGFAFTGFSEKSALIRWNAMNPEAKRIFGCGGEKPCPPGTLVKQKDLAKVLKAIAAHGADGFYDGWTAQRIADGVRAGGGIMTVGDLKAYRAKWREPVISAYRGMEIVSMPPPSSGGILLKQLLGYAERADKDGRFAEGFASASMIHALSHAMSLAFADRSKHLGDPDSAAVPAEGLVSPGYLDRRWSTFDPAKAAMPAAPGDVEEAKEPKRTTHLSVIDAEGNAVSMTLTVNDYWGSGFVPPGTGIVMNNQMDDFSSQPGVPNAFGLIGGEANSIAPRKRPLSSMTPAVARDGQGVNRIVIGAEGGPRIITSVFLSLFNRLRLGMELPDAVAAPRFHHQWKPAHTALEPFGFSSDTQSKLKAFGWMLKDSTDFGFVYALERLPDGRVIGAADIRSEGACAAE